MKIVILGGCGYIGSKLFHYLIEKDYRVDTVDLEWFGNFVNPANIKSDFKDLPKKKFDNYDVVILLAGHSTVGMCENDRIGSFKNNVENFIDLVGKLKKQKFIYASTYRVYGNPAKHFAKETDSLSPLCMYDFTKQTIDNYSSLSPLEFYSLRFATVNGYSPNLRVVQIINKLFISAQTNKNIPVYNIDAIFSVLGVNDLCRAINQIIIGGDKRGIYNLASFDTNINSIMKELQKHFREVDVSIAQPVQKSNHIRINATKFEKTYNFKFEDTIQNTILGLIKNFSERTHTFKSL